MWGKVRRGMELCDMGGVGKCVWGAGGGAVGKYGEVREKWGRCEVCLGCGEL